MTPTLPKICAISLFSLMTGCQHAPDVPEMTDSEIAAQQQAARAKTEESSKKSNDAMNAMVDLTVNLQICAVNYAVQHKTTKLTGSEMADAALSACESITRKLQIQAELTYSYQDPAFSMDGATKFGKDMRKNAEDNASHAVLRSIAESKN